MSLDFTDSIKCRKCREKKWLFIVRMSALPKKLHPFAWRTYWTCPYVYGAARAHKYLDLRVRIYIWTCEYAYIFLDPRLRIYFWTWACAYVLRPASACASALAHILFIYYSYLDPCTIRPHKGLGMSRSLPASEKHNHEKSPQTFAHPVNF